MDLIVILLAGAIVGFAVYTFSIQAKESMKQKWNTWRNRRG